jgi:hypothetical protein
MLLVFWNKYDAKVQTFYAFTVTLFWQILTYFTHFSFFKRKMPR